MTILLLGYRQSHITRQNEVCIVSSSLLRATDALVLSTKQTYSQPKRFNVILLSGFLCFSFHSGFDSSLEDLDLTDCVNRYAGTSSGVLAASMIAYGLTASEMAADLPLCRPLAECWLAATLWQGILCTQGLQRCLTEILSPTFEDLPVLLSMGVYGVETLSPKLVTLGLTIATIAASCAVLMGMLSPV